MDGQCVSMKQQIYTQSYQIEDAVDERLCLASSDYPSFPRDPNLSIVTVRQHRKRQRDRPQSLVLPPNTLLCAASSFRKA